MGWGEQMKYTKNLNLKKPDLIENVLISDLNENMDVLDTVVSELQEGSASIPDLETDDKTLVGAINELAEDYSHLRSEIYRHVNEDMSHTLWLEEIKGTENRLIYPWTYIWDYENGLAVSFAAKFDSTAAVTLNIRNNGDIPIKKTNGTPVTNLKAGGVYTVRYYDGAFILQGESEVEIGKQIITPTTTNQAILKGVHDGTGYVVGSPNLLPSNIKSGVNIFNVVGNLKTSKDITIQKITVNIYATTSGPYSSSVQLPDSTAKPMYYTCTGVFGSYPESWSGGYRYYINTQVKSDLSTYINFYISGENGRTVTLIGNVVMRDGKYFFDFTATGSWDNVDLNSGFLTFYISFICEK